jgi:tetratricopeptide (TPR) repeat protein
MNKITNLKLIIIFLLVVHVFTFTISCTESANSHNLRGLKLYQAGKYEEALLEYNKAIEIQPKDYAYYFNRARTYLEMGETAKAISDYTKVIELSPDLFLFRAYYGRGYTHFEAHQYDAAIADFNKSISIDPKDEWSYYWRGSSHEWKWEITGDKGEQELAIADLEKFIALSDDGYLADEMEKPIDFLINQTRELIERIKTNNRIY